ncbi:hypothetical protein CNR22_23190 [Sphingobacteriaceae bacterium]|nr:hypothetical protein CNR22_23190 [Sphingobacteriaceae bacterium]
MKELKKYMIWFGILVLLITCGDSAMTILSILVYIFLGILLLLIAVILFVICVEAIEDGKFSRFKKKNEGHYFLMYGINWRLKKNIELDLKPCLDIQYKDILINRDEIVIKQNEMENGYLFKETNMVKFPRVMRIVEGKMQVVSFYSEICKLKSGEINKDAFKKEVEIKLQKLQK